ncbi:MAG: hypothetical protein ACTHMX_15530, partial [Thermomicrobiales bacterium]
LVRSDFRVEVEIHGPCEAVKEFISPDLAVLDPIDTETTRLVSATESLQWFAWRLSSIPFPMRVISPPELADAFQAFGDRMHAIAAASGSSPAQPAG